MISAFRLLILLIGLSPLFLAFDSLLMHGILVGYVAVMVLIVAWSIRPGEAAFLTGITRPALIFAFLPAVWIVLQAIPIPFNGLRHPIWISAEAALGRSIWGSITISPGDTLLALARYFSACGLFFVAAAVTIDRQRAETVLLWLAGMTTLLALTLIVHNLGGFLFLGEISSIGARASITAAATLGTVLTSTTVIYAIERYETRRSRADFSRGLFVIMIVTSLGALILTLVAVALFASRPALFASLSGVGTFILIIGFRRIGLGAGLGFLLACVAVAVPLSVIAGDFFVKSPDLSLRFLTEAPKSLVDLTQRMIADSNWAGSGAGTFAALLPIYQDTSNSIIASVAPTTAAGYLIELGRPALWVAIAAALAAIGWLTHGALQRGRDSFFTAAGASCTVILALEAFFDASLSGSTTIVLAMSILGLAVSQSVSRTARQL
ncbi:MAG: hypothetical protein PSV22_22745 [Pseudolabrys sp.]|nr:hypothetical protein [Pseudolabrys sp.]